MRPRHSANGGVIHGWIQFLSRTLTHFCQGYEVWRHGRWRGPIVYRPGLCVVVRLKLPMQSQAHHLQVQLAAASVGRRVEAAGPEAQLPDLQNKRGLHRSQIEGPVGLEGWRNHRALIGPYQV